jgi:hypothetical protein
MVIVEQSVEWELPRETEVLGESLPQCHFVRNKSHMTCAVAVGSRRITAWAMARLYVEQLLSQCSEPFTFLRIYLCLRIAWQPHRWSQHYDLFVSFRLPCTALNCDRLSLYIAAYALYRTVTRKEGSRIRASVLGCPRQPIGFLSIPGEGPRLFDRMRGARRSVDVITPSSDPSTI